MKHKNLFKIFFIWIIALAATTALLFLLRGPALIHADSPHYVALDCTGVPTPCHTSIQDAVDAASPGDEIWVEQGHYTGVHVRAGAVQVIYISKTVTIRGGYDNSFQHSFPMTQPTVVDAAEAGRVIYITGSSGNISPTIEGLWITGGNASNTIDNGRGGGIYSDNAIPIVVNNVVSHNIAYTGTSVWGYGGGIYIEDSPGTAIISGNQVISNVASTAYYGDGGGLYVIASPVAQVIDNVVLSNTAAVTGGLGYGGGLTLSGSSGTIVDDNRIEHNVAQAGLAPAFGSEGGGICCWNSNDVVFSDNVVRYNAASIPSNGQGGGIATWDCDRLTVVGNTIQGNVGSTGTTSGGGRGGGLSAYASRDLIINANRVLSNTAGFYTGWGGGLYLSRNTTFTMTNNIVAGNVASYQGGGLAFETDASEPVTGTLLHNTFAANNQGSGDGRSAIHVNESYVSLILTNNLICSHTYGILVDGSSTAQLYTTLFYANDTDTSGAGIVNTNPITGQDPLLDGDYHLQADSPAINAGVDAGVSTDIDGESRDSAPDIGADEDPNSSPPDGNIYLPVIIKNH